MDNIIKFNPWWTESNVPQKFLGSYEREVFDYIKSLFNKRQMLLFYGLRRVGKTFLMYKTIDDLIKNGVNPLHIMYFSFDEKIEGIEKIISEYEERVLKEKISNIPKVYIFLDEIQKEKEWQDKIKILYDLNPNIKIILSGSVSVSLQYGSKESLAGRIIDIMIKPLSFKEFAEAKGVKIDISSHIIYENTAVPLFMDYLRKGGYVELVNETDDSYIRTYIIDILNRIVYKDLPEEFGIKDLDLMKILLESFLKDPGMIMNIERLSRDLGRSKITIANYIKYLKHALIIREVKNLRHGLLVSSRKGKKIYPSNTGFSFAFREDFYSNNFLEKVAEIAVATKLEAEYFYRNSYEVDFIDKRNNKVIPIEVKYGEISQKQILQFLKEYKLKKGILVSKKDTLPEKDGVEIIPLWVFMFKD